MKQLFLFFACVFAASSVNAQEFDLRKPGCSSAMASTVFKAIDTTADRGVADNYLTWEPGQVIRVKFMPGGGKVLRDKVRTYAKEWEKYANIKFEFLPDNTTNTQIRVKLGKDLGHNSAMGTQCNIYGQNEHTLHLDTLYLADFNYYRTLFSQNNVPRPYTEEVYRKYMGLYPNHWNEKELYSTVVHEFGHALGLKHEQSYPGAIKWNRSDSVYDYYERTQGWGRDMVDHNVFDAAHQFYTNGTEYDPKSIMHYSIQPWETTNGYSVSANYILSEGDKKLIAALYPRNPAALKNVVPKVQIDNFSGMDISYDESRKGLVMYPKLDLKTNSRLGEVWVVARLVYYEGYYVRSNFNYYNWGGTVATYYKLNLMPSKSYSMNKGNKSFEMFLPEKYIPELASPDVYIQFSVYLDDPTNNQQKRLLFSKEVEPGQSLKKFQQ